LETERKEREKLVTVLKRWGPLEADKQLKDAMSGKLYSGESN